MDTTQHASPLIDTADRRSLVTGQYVPVYIAEMCEDDDMGFAAMNLGYGRPAGGESYHTRDELQAINARRRNERNSK